MAISVRIEGLERLLKKASPDILAKPLRNFFERASLAVENRAKEKAPVDTGRLRSSLAHEIDGAAVPLWAKVGTNVTYAPFMEFGTGAFAEGPGGGSGGHWPPGAALDVWASRHGFASGFQVARIIGRRGGLRPRRYLRDGLAESVGDIGGFLNRAGSEIRAAWDG